MTEPEAPVCGCGEVMELSDTSTRTSIPIVGSEYEVRVYTCPNCGLGTRLERKDGGEAWQRASP